MKLIRLIFLLTSLFFVEFNLMAQNNGQKSSTELLKEIEQLNKLFDHLSNKWTYRNGSNNFITDLFIFEGDEVKITAEGIIKIGNFSGSTGPDGFYGRTGFYFNKVSKFPYGALLCKIGELGDYRLVGESIEFIAETSGRLRLAVNDSDVTDNRGYFFGKISFSSPHSSGDHKINREENIPYLTENQKKELKRVRDHNEEIRRKYARLQKAKERELDSISVKKKEIEYNKAVNKLEEAKRKIREARKAKESDNE